MSTKHYTVLGANVRGDDLPNTPCFIRFAIMPDDDAVVIGFVPLNMAVH